MLVKIILNYWLFKMIKAKRLCRIATTKLNTKNKAIINKYEKTQKNILIIKIYKIILKTLQ